MIDKDRLLDCLTEENVLSLLESFGATHHPIKTNEIWFRTVCHGGDSHKLCYYRDSKEFVCYTNCGKMNIFSLVMHIKDCNFLESLKYIADYLGLNQRYGFNKKPIIDKSTEDLQLEGHMNIRKRKDTDGENSEVILSVYDSNILNYFDNTTFFEGWINEGISISTMQHFNISWYDLERYIVIPHFNINGELVGIRRRSLNIEDIIAKRKYTPLKIENIMYTHSLGSNIYGLNFQQAAIKKYKKAIIVESEKAAMLGYEYYGEDSCVVATCGFNITNWQKNTLLKLGVEEIILAFDKDFEPSDFINADKEDGKFKEYQRYVKRIYSLAYKFVPFCSTYVIWDDKGLLCKKDSPLDRGKDIFEELLRNKYEVTTEKEGD